MFRHASLNRIYRLVWSETRNAFVAVAENTRARGKRSGTVGHRRGARLRVGACGALGLAALPWLAHAAAPTTVVPVAGSKTAAYIAPNGVPVVDINTANAAGVSHNQYTKYNVDPKGLVLNNGNNAQMARQSQLAGQVMANANLSAEAKLILNEVVAPNRSQLSGFTEVLGGRADVVVANPYGITCSGCGFINTDRVTLTTGVPVLGGNGALNGFNVTGGDLLINGSGLNASAQQVLDLVARSIRVEGNINAADLGVVAGANAWDYAARAVTGALAGTDGTPQFAIDSTLLGGMYANRIKIVATEAGVGVRMLGDAAASGSDFTIDAAGRIALQNKVSAERDVRIATTSNDAAALTATDATLTAKRNVDLSAAQGGAILNGGVLTAGNDLGIDVASLSDAATATALADNNKRFAGGGLHVHATGSVDLNGVSHGAGGALDIASGGSTTVGAAGATLYGNTVALQAGQNLALGTAAVKASGALSLAAQQAISTASGAAQGIQSTGGDIAVGAAAFVNGGTVSADAGKLALRVDALTNAASGTLQSAMQLSIADRSGGGAGTVDNAGRILSAADLDIDAATVLNSGTVQAATGSAVDAGSATNTGTWIGSTDAGADARFDVGTLTNSGTLQAARDVVVAADALNNSNKVLATRDLLIAARGGALAIDNQSGGVLQAGNRLQLRGNTALANRAGATALANTLDIDIASADNGGTLQAGSGGATLLVDGALANSGKLLSAGTMTIDAGSIANTGTVQSALNSSTTAASITNAGNWLASNTAGYSATFDANSLTNSGTLQASQDLGLKLRNALVNSGKVLAGRDLLIEAKDAGSTLAVTNKTDGTLQAGNLLQLRGVSGGSNVTLLTEANSKALAHHFDVIVNGLTNAGTIQGGAGASTFTVNGTLANSAGGVLYLATNAAGSATVNANTLTNAGNMRSDGATTLNIGTALTNTGSIVNGGDLVIRGRTNSTYSITTAGRLESLSLLDIKGYAAGSGVDVTVNGGGILRGGALALKAGTLTVADNGTTGGIVHSLGDMTLDVGTLSFGGQRSRIIGATDDGDVTITLANAFTNPGAIHSGGDLTFTLPGLTNSSTGGISALGTLKLTANSGNIANYGALYAGELLDVSATGTLGNYADNSGFSGTMDSSDDMKLTASTFINNSAINASGDIIVSAATFRNEVPGGDTRAWGSYSTKTHTETGHDGQGYNGHGCCDQYETWYYEDTWYRDQYYTGGTPQFSPELIAGGSLTVRDFNTGTNLGAVMSGSAVYVIGLTNSASFTNDALALERESKKETYAMEIKYIAAGPAEYYNDFDDDHHRSSTTTTTYSTLSSLGAGIYANGPIQVTNIGALTNAGTPLGAAVNSQNPGGAGDDNTTVTKKGSEGGAAGVGGSAAVGGAQSITLGGQTIRLPSNPNGYYVPNKDPGAAYLVETNPLFAVGSSVVGSNYLAERYGYDPEVVVKRLGDANYEAFLMKQQLKNQIGANLIAGYANEAAQVQGLMDNAVAEGKRLGFEYGKAPTAAQLASLKEDVVWMVETEVAGQKVLAPVVYLSAATRSSYESGNAVFAGSKVEMNVDTFANTGGTVSGRDQLSITAKNDITNTSGTIKGGDVQLASLEGNIVNQTYVNTTGDASSSQATTVGQQASIQATNNLSLDAAKDITNLGANMAAGGDASLAAGGNVTFDTVENRNASTTHSWSSNGFTSTSNSTTVATTEQIKSGLTTGGNLTVKSQNDITFAGTDVKAGGDADIDAKGDVNLLARANTTTTTSRTVTDGVGVGGGLAGVETTDSEQFRSRNVGSTLDVGGNAKLNAGKDLTLEGSKVDVGGNADIAATNVNVLAGKDEDRTTTTTTTTTFMKVDSGSSNSSSSSDSGSSATSGDGAAGAEASASARADNTSSGGIKFAESSTTTTSTYDKTSVGSSINVGGNVNIDAKETVKLVGSEINAGGDASVKATDVKVLAAQDIHTSSTTTTTTSVGLSATSTNTAGAQASADAGADSNDMSARANAEASADASSKNYIELSNTTTTTSDSLEINNQGSAIKSGGNMSIDASNKLTTQGSTLESGGDMNLQAKDMEFLAADDVKVTTTTSDTTSFGMYRDASAEAKAGATAGGDGIGYTSADASVNASAKAGIEAGFEGSNTKTSNTEGSTTAVTSSIKSGGNMTRTATGNITDVGTQIEAGGDFTQSATTIDSKAAKDTTFSSSSSDSHTARFGAYAEADASVEAGADSSGQAGAEAGANAGAGLHASYKNEQSSSSSNSSTAVVSNIKAGGSINSTSSGKTSMEGTNLASGGDVNLEAGSLDYKAAQNTESSSESNSNIDADVKAGINFGSDGKVKGSLAGGYGTESSTESSTTAVTGSISSGGNLNIKTKDDARFEGTNLDAGGDANIAAGGNVTFDAAKNTQTSSSEGYDVAAELNLSKSKSGDKKGGLQAEGGYNSASSDASQAVVSNVNSGGKLNISAGKDATFEGTNISSGDDASISAKNNLAFNAARDTSSSESLGVDASLEVGAESGSGKSSKTGGLSAEVEYSKEKSSTAVTGSINSGGNLKLSSGNDTTLEGTQVGAAGTVGIDAGGKVDVKAARSTSESLSVGGGIGGGVESSNETDAAGANTKQTTRSGDLSIDIEGGKSSTATVASISGGKGIDISAGSDASFEGTKLQSNGDTNIAAGGDVRLTAAQSSEISGGFAGGISSDTGPKLNKAEIGGGVQNEVATIDTAGNLNIKSGGKTVLEGTQATAGDTATIDAQGGVEKKTVVSGGAELGLTKADASLDVQKTSIQSEGRALVPMTDNGFKTSVPVPANLPAGKKVEAATADGKPLPSWLKFDPATGSFSGTPPADFKGNLNVVVKVPDANGGTTEIPLRFQGQ